MQNILGIARYEFLMQWRGRSMRVLALTMLLVTCAGVLIWNSVPEGEFTRLINMNERAFSINILLTFLTFPALVALVAFVFPVASSESIPSDKHHRTIELINSLPVTTAEYLSGKLVGYWFAGMSALVFAFVINSVLWWLTLPSYDLISYTELWFASAIVLVVNTGIAILIGGTQPNRIRAAALIICIFILSTLLLVDGGTSQTPGIGALISLSRLKIITAFVNPDVSNALRLRAPQVYLSVFAGVIELVIAFAAMWLWRRRGE